MTLIVEVSRAGKLPYRSDGLLLLRRIAALLVVRHHLQFGVGLHQ